MFGEKGKFVISGGNDKSVKLWDWSKSFDVRPGSGSSDLLCSNFSLSRKVSPYSFLAPCFNSVLIPPRIFSSPNRGGIFLRLTGSVLRRWIQRT